MNTTSYLAFGLCLLMGTLACNAAASSVSPATFPDPSIDAPLANAKGTQTLVVAGGCFWGLQTRIRSELLPSTSQNYIRQCCFDNLLERRIMILRICTMMRPTMWFMPCRM